MAEQYRAHTSTPEQSAETTNADILHAKTPIDRLLRGGSELHFPETQAMFEQYGDSILDAIEQTRQAAQVTPDDYPPSPPRHASSLGPAANILRDLAELSANQTSTDSKANNKRPPVVTPLATDASATQVANLARNIIRTHPNPADLIAVYSKKFEEKRQIAEDFHLDYHEPEQFMRVLEQLLPVIYGERYTAYRRVVDEAAAAAEASARQQMIAEQEQAALTELDERGQLYTHERLAGSVRASAGEALANSMSITGIVVAHARNHLARPRRAHLKRRQQAAARRWQRRQDKADRALLFRGWRAKRAGKAKARYDKRSTAVNTHVAAAEARVNTAHSRAEIRDKAVQARYTQINERAIAAKMRQMLRAEERTIRNAARANRMTRQQERDRLRQLCTPIVQKHVRAEALEALRRQAIRNGTYYPGDLPVTA